MTCLKNIKKDTAGESFTKKRVVQNAVKQVFRSQTT